MGSVYRASRRRYTQEVAIKVIKRAERPGTLRRFQTERQVSHNSSIKRCPATDGGTTEDGRPYFVMEFISVADRPAFPRPCAADPQVAVAAGRRRRGAHAQDYPSRPEASQCWSLPGVVKVTDFACPDPSTR
jgi:hypothetical protein